MEKSNMKRPPDVNEAISSMLWTPYEQSMQTSSSDSPSSSTVSSSTESFSDDEQLLEEQRRRLFNRRSNPLPNSLNWWNSQSQNHYNHEPEHQQHPITTSSRYSFPYYGNYLPSSRHFNTPLASKQIVGDDNRHGQIIIHNTLPFQPTMVHSFTDDFYRFQVINIFSFNFHFMRQGKVSHPTPDSLKFPFIMSALCVLR